jgi:hypothetical protein
MNRFLPVAACFLLAISFCDVQCASAAPQADNTPAASSLSQGDQTTSDEDAIRGVFPSILVKPLDSKKLKQGDQVVCQTTAVLHTRNGMVIPNRSKVLGQVTQATARSKGDSESSLAIAFDKIQLPNGKDVPFKGVLQAVAPSLGGNSGPDTGAAGPGTLPTGNGRGGDTSTMPAPMSTRVPDTAGVHPLITSQSSGVLGIPNLQMDKDSVLTSSGKDVKLESGTQMLIRAEIQQPAQ